MKQYRIYLTEELTIKAINKGCPIPSVGYSDGWTKQIWVANPEYNRDIPTTRSNIPGWNYDLPTAEEMCGWLREKNILITIELFPDETYTASIHILKEGLQCALAGYKSYEEALLIGIDWALNYLKDE